MTTKSTKTTKTTKTTKSTRNRKAGRAASINTDTARVDFWAARHRAMLKSLKEWQIETVAAMKREGIVSFTLKDASAFVAREIADGQKNDNARKRLQRFRRELELAGIKVMRSKQGGANSGNTGPKDKPKTETETETAKAPSKVATPAETVAYLRTLIASHTASAERKKDASIALDAVAAFFEK